MEGARVCIRVGVLMAYPLFWTKKTTGASRTEAKLRASWKSPSLVVKAGQVPGGAETVLNAAMANRMGSMYGGFVMAPNAVYEIEFTGAPVGEYFYVCTPHEALGMVATLTIE